MARLTKEVIAGCQTTATDKALPMSNDEVEKRRTIARLHRVGFAPELIAKKTYNGSLPDSLIQDHPSNLYPGYGGEESPVTRSQKRFAKWVDYVTTFIRQLENGTDSNE